MSFALVSGRTRDVVASRVELAFTRRARRRGLLGREALASDAAMFLAPCLAIHTAFLGFPIDVAFIDRDGRVVRLVHELRPWRAAAAFQARAVIELAAGRLEACGVEVGDLLYLRPQPC